MCSWLMLSDYEATPVRLGTWKVFVTLLTQAFIDIIEKLPIKSTSKHQELLAEGRNNINEIEKNQALHEPI